MSEHKLLSDAEYRELLSLASNFRDPHALETQITNAFVSHISAQAAEIERLRADGERYRALRGLAIQHTEVVVCVENHANDDEAPEYEWIIDLGSTGESVGSGGTCDAAIDNARANEEGR